MMTHQPIEAAEIGTEEISAKDLARRVLMYWEKLFGYGDIGPSVPLTARCREMLGTWSHVETEPHVLHTRAQSPRFRSRCIVKKGWLRGRDLNSVEACSAGSDRAMGDVRSHHEGAIGKNQIKASGNGLAQHKS
jgi:hypothetical protein